MQIYDRLCKQGNSPLLSIPEQVSPEVQNWSVVPQKIHLKESRIALLNENKFRNKFK